MTFAAVPGRNHRVGQPASQIVFRHARQPATRRQTLKVFHDALSLHPADNAAMWSDMDIAAEIDRRRNVGEVVDGYVVAEGDEFRIFDYRAGANPHIHAAPL